MGEVRNDLFFAGWPLTVMVTESRSGPAGQWAEPDLLHLELFYGLPRCGNRLSQLSIGPNACCHKLNPICGFKLIG
jgi:hypothetical protein